MHEELLRKMIRTKLKIGMHVINELPQPIQKQAQSMITILQEELSAYVKAEQAKPKQNLQSIHID